ncbi:unnamed protein product [Eruca vesicaria subsp. sativa]|uniref:Uncharacterized protein n=1 Tax=Eruca vesicaria subsp. sativa TaxID=29727 RepID=A0ABC8IS73_ERUVS|nr:unnamed protein product [Eruca vesicaria subsp. sativa]
MERGEVKKNMGKESNSWLKRLKQSCLDPIPKLTPGDDDDGNRLEVIPSTEFAPRVLTKINDKSPVVEDTDGSSTKPENQGGSKRKRQESREFQHEDMEIVDMGEELPEGFWSKAPFNEVHAEFKTGMGMVRTARKYSFVEELLEQISSPVVSDGHKYFMDVAEDDESDHIILEMEEHRGAGSVFEYFRCSRSNSRMDTAKIDSQEETMVHRMDWKKFCSETVVNDKFVIDAEVDQISHSKWSKTPLLV